MRRLLGTAALALGAMAAFSLGTPEAEGAPTSACRVQYNQGHSGELRAAVALPGQAVPWQLTGCEGPLVWRPVDDRPASVSEPLGEVITAPGEQGAYRLSEVGSGAVIGPRLMVLLPFDQKQGDRVGAYRLGRWPGENGTPAMYELPVGFVRVSKEMAKARVSTRLTLGSFLTKNQSSVWPKYVLLDMRLIDKLELIAADLRQRGLGGEHITIMSGFRTPAYNAPGVGAGGRAKHSRHVYGDAADMWVDDDRDGRLDDLDRNGTVNYLDAQVLMAAQERVEARYPDLVGGGGVYRATPAHGPFLHVDVRGSVARWGLQAP